MKYRADIDGLRAAAVVPVVLYHCGFARFVPGGFVGVDVFFVISGFLITSLIRKDLLEGNFSIWRFYERRVRRIFPALMAMFLFIIVASFFLLMPGAFANTSSQILSSLLFVSNIYFMYQSGYFEAGSESNAVLHTWSLSVEEQFYIFLPIALLLLRRLQAATIFYILLVAAVVSGLTSQWLLNSDINASYYLIQSRAWELLAGSLLALGVVPPPKLGWVANGLGLAGILLIIGSALLIDARQPFPGLLALPVCLGTCLVIYSGTEVRTWVARGLSLYPVNFVGKISYSLYLWHWPLWVLGEQVYQPKTIVERLVFLAICTVVATISWHFVEGPFRRQSPRTGSKGVVMIGVVCAAVVGIVSVVSPVVARNFWQVPPAAERVAEFTYNPNPPLRAATCFLTSGTNDISEFDRNKCLPMDRSRPNVILIGDSHAAHMYPGFANYPSINVLQATASGCSPLIKGFGAWRCTELMRFTFEEFLPKNPVDMIILSARWHASDISRIAETVRYLKLFAKEVVVIGPINEYDLPLPTILGKAMYRQDLSLPAAHRRSEPIETDRQMRGVAETAGAKYISMISALCPQSDCIVWTSDGNPLQFDYGHLTAEGSKLAVSRIADSLGITNLTAIGNKHGK